MKHIFFSMLLLLATAGHSAVAPNPIDFPDYLQVTAPLAEQNIDVPGLQAHIAGIVSEADTLSPAQKQHLARNVYEALILYGQSYMHMDDCTTDTLQALTTTLFEHQMGYLHLDNVGLTASIFLGQLQHQFWGEFNIEAHQDLLGNWYQMLESQSFSHAPIFFVGEEDEDAEEDMLGYDIYNVNPENADPIADVLDFQPQDDPQVNTGLLTSTLACLTHLCTDQGFTCPQILQIADTIRLFVDEFGEIPQQPAINRLKLTLGGIEGFEAQLDAISAQIKAPLQQMIDAVEEDEAAAAGGMAVDEAAAGNNRPPAINVRR